MRWALYLGLVLAISATFVQCQEDAKPSEVIEDPKPVSEEPIEAADELKQDEPVEEVDDEEKIEDPEAIDDPKESEESSDGSEVSEDSEVSEEFPNAVSAEEDLTPDSNDKFDGEESSENDETEGEEIDEDYVNDQGVEELILPPGDEDDIPIPPPPPPPKDEEEKECREDLKGNEGKFSSANFPDAYPERSNCSWNIEVDEGMKVQLTFHLFNVESNPNCIWDWAKVVDSNGTVIKHICGYLQQDLVVTSSDRNVSVILYSDGVVQSAGFLASWLAIPIDAVVNEESQAERDEGYLLTFPQTFTTSEENLEESVCLQVFNVAQDGEVKVGLYDSSNILEGEPTVESVIETVGGSSEIQCTRLTLPQDFSKGSAILKVEGSFADSDYKILSYKSVRALALQPLFLVQTDKGDYRPKQKVSFRVLTFNYELKPSKIQVLPEVWITNPADDRLFQWKDVALEKGLVQLDFPLSEEPVLGKWTIHVKYDEGKDEDKTHFDVSESVLPKFEVNVVAPKVIIRDAEEATFKVCATYTHGGKVKGSVNATIFSTYKAGNYWRAPTLKTSVDLVGEVKNGCAELKLNGTDIRDMTNKTTTINLEATFTEAVTGTEAEAKWKGEVQKQRFKIEFGSSPKDHIVGKFPYVGEVLALSHDGIATEEIELEVCARLYTSVDKLRNFVNSKSYEFYTYTEEQFHELGQIMSKIQFASTCEIQKTDSEGRFKLSVPMTSDLPNNVTKLSFSVKAVDYETNVTSGIVQPVATHEVLLTHSNATNALALTDTEPTFGCGTNEIEVFFSAKPESEVELNYYVSSGGALVHQGVETVQVGTDNQESQYIGSANVIKVQPEPETEEDEETKTILSNHVIKIARPFEQETLVAGTIKLLVFIRDAEGKTLSTTRNYEAESCAKQPTMTWSKEKYVPGEEVTIKIAGAGDALCGYSIVDKSVDLVSNPNKITQPRAQELKEAIAGKRIVNDVNFGEGCEDANLLFKAFERLGLFIMSDQLVISTKCDSLKDVTGQKNRDRPDYGPVPVALEFAAFQDDVQADAFEPPVAFAAAPPRLNAANRVQVNGFAEGAPPPPLRRKQAQPSSSVRENAVELRNYFPETWLFDLVSLDVDGNAVLDVKAPHTITSWVGEVVCTHEEAGLGVSNKTSAVVSQDFFADIILPYSVKRGEILPVNVSVFNTVGTSLPMRLTIQESDSYKLDAASSEVCLSAEDNTIKTFRLKAKELNEVNITVEAMITDGIEAECETSKAAEGFTDVLVKPIVVKPEGFPVEKVESIFECKSAEDEDMEVVLKDLELPENVVEGSERAWFTLTGNIMAPSLANLDKLVRLPTGCGEQTMIGMAPNVYLMDYMQGTGKVDEKLQERAKRYMRTGYEREQKFRFKDGSYSVWGPKTDKSGSIWLSSFVTKVFSQASRFVDIERANVDQTIRWIISNQKKNGCFNKTGYIIHGELAGTDQSLTASVLVTLLEYYSSFVDNSGNKIATRIPVDVINNAMTCIRANLTEETETYTKTVTAYAFSLYNNVREKISADLPEAEEAGNVLNELILAANSSVAGQMFWTTKDNSKATAVETTAYNVLSLTLQDKLPEALKAIKWMATQRNSRGGFVSTQDTMVALQAMSAYSLKVSEEAPDLSVIVNEADAKHDHQLTGDNLLLLQRQRLESVPNKISASVSGNGCFMIQTVLRYNVRTSPDQNSFTLTAEQVDEDSLQVCAAYTGSKKATDMVVIEIELLSGFTASRESIEVLTNEIEAPVKKFEYDEEKGDIVLYFDGIPKSEACWSIETKRAVDIQELKPAIVKIYDYYNQEDVFSTEYNLVEKAEEAKEEKDE